MHVIPAERRRRADGTAARLRSLFYDRFYAHRHRQTQTHAAAAAASQKTVALPTRSSDAPLQRRSHALNSDVRTQLEPRNALYNCARRVRVQHIRQWRTDDSAARVDDASARTFIIHACKTARVTAARTIEHRLVEQLCRATKWRGFVRAYVVCFSDWLLCTDYRRILLNTGPRSQRIKILGQYDVRVSLAVVI